MKPSFFSAEFHTDFFPALLWSKVHSKREERTGFSSILELHVLFFICLIVAAVAVPLAVSQKSIIAWIVAGISFAGILTLVLNSVSSRNGPPSFDSFLVWIFLFFVMLGPTGGILVGAIQHSLFLGLAVGIGGLIPGYVLGIWAGLWIQCVGWVSSILNGLAMLAILGMLMLDIVLLFSVIL